MSKFEQFPPEENLENLIPHKFRNLDLTSDILEEVWVIPEYADPAITKEMKDKKRKAIEYLKAKEAGEAKTEDSPEPENQTAKDIKMAFEGLKGSFSRGKLEKIKEYDERIKAVQAGTPIKNYDKIEDLKKDFRQLSGIDWAENLDIDKL